MLTGAQGVTFSLVARRYAALTGILPPCPAIHRFTTALTLEQTLIAAAALFLAGCAGIVYCLHEWVQARFGPLPYAQLVPL